MKTLFQQRPRVAVPTGTQESISAGLVMKGELQFVGPAIMNGRLEGAIRSLRKIVVGSIGWIKGQLECGECEVHGKVYGDIKIEGTLTIVPNAVCRGNIHAGALEIHPGADVKATINVHQTIRPKFNTPVVQPFSPVKNFLKQIFG